MGRYSKKRKQEEARIRAEDAKKTFVENILEFSEKQQEELERLERRINRKKILINKKYRVAYDKIQKEEREKQQRIFEKYDRYIEKRQNEIKGDLESIEEKKNKISLRQFLLKVILERETGVKTAWTEESSDVAVEAKISISGGIWISCILCGWMMTAPWWMSFPPLSKTWWNMISLSQKNR